jgi:hypothetical protein
MSYLPHPPRSAPSVVTAVPVSLQRIRAWRDLEHQIALAHDRLACSLQTLTVGESMLRDTRQQLRIIRHRWALLDAES